MGSVIGSGREREGILDVDVLPALIQGNGGRIDS